MNTTQTVWPVAFCLLIFSLVFAIPAGAQATITTFKDTGVATEPFGAAADGAGNVFIADRADNVIRKITSGGVMTVVAGTPGVSGAGGDGGPAVAAQLNFPLDVELDASGNIYIADTLNHAIRVVNTQVAPITVFNVLIGPGQIKTVAGAIGVTGVYDPTPGPATATTLFVPFSIALDGTGNMYIADLGNNAVREVNPGGTMVTVVGQGPGSGFGGDGGAAPLATLNHPKSVAVDANHNLYIADSGNFRIRLVNNQGGPITLFNVTIGHNNIDTIAGSSAGNSGNGGPATIAQMNDADGIAVDPSGNLYIAIASDHVLRLVNPGSDTITAFAGTGVAGNTGDGGAPTAAQLDKPFGLALGPGGIVYIADATSHVIRKITPAATTQIIIFGALGNRTFGDPPFGISATGGASGQPVIFSSTTPEVCTVAGSTVTLVSTGTCSIAANQAGNLTYSAAPTVTQSFSVAAPASRLPNLDQAITFLPLRDRTPADPPFTVAATGGDSGVPVRFSSATPTVCTVSGNTVSLVGGPGVCTIVANQNGAPRYNPAPAVSQSFVVGCSLAANSGPLACSASSTGYSFPDRGGAAFSTFGNGNMTVGYGVLVPASGTTQPGAFAIFDYTANGVLVTEAAIPATPAVLSGRIYSEISGPTNTGIAFANPNADAVTISFYFTDPAGASTDAQNFTLGARMQTARFLNQFPFNKTGPFTGTLTFNASAPIGAIALRTFTNERNEFIATTQAIAPTIPGPNSPLIVAQFAAGGGWKTQLLLVNSSDHVMSGVVQFLGEGSGANAGTPLTLAINGQTGALFPYAIPARSSVRLETTGAPAAIQSGSVRVTPSGGSPAPSAFTLFSFTRNGVTVTQASVTAQQEGPAFRTYVESSGASGAPGSIRSGVAVANTTAAPATVNFELTTLGGNPTGITGSVTIPANGHIAKLLDELLPGASLPSRGVLRITSLQGAIAVAGFRTRYNERGDFLITTTPAINELSTTGSDPLVFPHTVNMGGYTMQFVVFSGTNPQIGDGTIRFFDQSGESQVLTDR